MLASRANLAIMHACMHNQRMHDAINIETQDPVGSSGKKPLQVRIPIDVKRRFKAKAAMLGIEPNELFVEMWEMYEKANSNAA
jgi:hypothetical protein